MARIRSPNYPAMSLPEAIDRIGAIHQKEQHLEAPREVMAKHLGYNGIHGSSLKALSALLKYGLLEKTAGDRRRVTELALQILHPRDPVERSSAIRDAAFRPALFAEIAKEWPNGTPSDTNLRAYLIRRNFAQDAIPEVIDAYRKTIELVAAESGSYTEAPEPERKTPQMPAQTAPAQQRRDPTPSYTTSYTPASGREPFRVSFVPGGIEVSGRITSRERADELIAAIQALRLLLRPLDSVVRPDEGEDDAGDEAAD
ncbi:MAG: hypothetical protein WA417_25010 [Stellaceae bacterium]